MSDLWERIQGAKMEAERTLDLEAWKHAVRREMNFFPFMAKEPLIISGDLYDKAIEWVAEWEMTGPPISLKFRNRVVLCEGTYGS